MGSYPRRDRDKETSRGESFVGDGTAPNKKMGPHKKVGWDPSTYRKVAVTGRNQSVNTRARW